MKSNGFFGCTILGDGSVGLIIDIGSQSLTPLFFQALPRHQCKEFDFYTFVCRYSGCLFSRTPKDYFSLVGGIGVGSKIDCGLSVNYGVGQLDLTRMEPAVLDDYFGASKYKVVKDKSEIEIAVAKGRTGQELFPFLMVALCFLFIGEYVFSNRFYQ